MTWETWNQIMLVFFFDCSLLYCGYQLGRIHGERYAQKWIDQAEEVTCKAMYAQREAVQVIHDYRDKIEELSLKTYLREEDALSESEGYRG